MAVRQLKKSPKVRPSQAPDSYARFDKLNGQHPWMQILPEGFVSYRVRELNTGKIPYFNFALAKEMGLIPADHPHQLTAALRDKLIKTFSIQIINEYDELKNRKFPQASVKPNLYMASRYLQLQHVNKQGKTSGDGRGIWNGQVEHRGMSWDVSSRGTGVTKLAPGAVEANRPLKTGGEEFGYGCGQAEIDELYGAAIMAEVMHLQGIPTERVLCIIDLGKNVGIGVRAAPCLIRPAHLFIYLKQNRQLELKAATDYLIARLEQNKRHQFKAKGAEVYFELAQYICDSFASFTAILDRDYIFAWLDWDGDNVLADAGIIDYGSVRQFGIRHDQYRYDDVERFSTNLNEQRSKARLIVQNFVQIADFLKTGKKRPLKDFAKHPVVSTFNKKFALARAHRLLYRVGFNKDQRDLILKETKLFSAFDRSFSYFERAKISGQAKKVADGINHPALFNMRKVMEHLPSFLREQGFKNARMQDEQFFLLALSSFAKSKDARLTTKHRAQIQEFQRLYKELVYAAAGGMEGVRESFLAGIEERAVRLNRNDRITGNALIHIVHELLQERKKGLSESSMQALLDQINYAYIGLPEVQESRHIERKPRSLHLPELYNRILNILASHSEDI